MLPNYTDTGQLIPAPAGTRAAAGSASRRTRATWLLRLFTALLFCQVWFDVAGFTVRAEDVLALLLLSGLLLPVLLTGRFRYNRNPLNLPLLGWAAALLLGVAVTLLSPFDGGTKKDSLVNGIRLVLAIGVFFVVQRHRAPAEVKLRAIISTVLWFSLVTTAVALLQMGYWDGWLPISLPAILITFKEGANTAPGRELFALYLGDTGSHAWSGALAMQALLAWVVARYTRKPWLKWLLWLYFVLLVFILIRVSVRNSILGLFVAIFGLSVLRGLLTRNTIWRGLRIGMVIGGTVVVLYALLYLAPDTYFIERVRQAIPSIENGQLVISRSSNVYGRFEYWGVAFTLFADSPLVGKGFYSYQALSEQFFSKTISHAHNSYLQTLAELGIVGAAALFWLLLSIGIYVMRTRNLTLSNKSAALWWEYGTGVCLFLAFTALFANSFGMPQQVGLLMLLLGCLNPFALEPGTKSGAPGLPSPDRSFGLFRGRVPCPGRRSVL